MTGIDPVQTLRNGIHVLAEKTVTLGFDGFVDSIARVIRNKSASRTDLFETIRQFGEYTLERSSGNFSLELLQVVKKPGGNMPIMALALAPWAGQVNCVGALGYPSIDPIFSGFPQNCNLLSFAEPGITTALEFNDGKIIMGEMSQLNGAKWENVKRVIGLERLTEAFKNSHLLGIVNWSELDYASDIWRGVLNEVLPGINYGHKPFAFFDLADCSKKSASDIRESLGIIREFGKWFHITLGLNRNEAGIIHKCLSNDSVTRQHDMNEIGDDLYQRLDIPTLIIHFHTTAMGWSEMENCIVETPRIDKPVISTGAGDNFNAGYCAGLLLGLKLPQCLELGHAFAKHYLQHGKSVTKEEV